MKKIVRWVMILSTAVLWTNNSIADDGIQLVPGASKSIDVDGGIKKVILSNPSIADVAPSGDGGSVLITALSIGSGELRIQRQTGEDMVYSLRVAANLSELAEEIKLLLADVEGLSVKTVGNKIVLDGELMTKAGYDRTMQVAQAYAGSILNLAKLDRQELNTYVAEAIERDIGLDTVKVRVAGDTATAEGIVYDEADLARISELAKMRVPNIVNLVKVEEVMIETDVYFVQIDNAKSKDMGYNVLKTLGVDAVAQLAGAEGESATYTYNVNAGISARINALVGKGEAKIVAQPHLSTKSGGTGRFHSGGEVYFAVSGVNAGNLEKVEHGVILTVKPTMRGKDRIMNEVGIEVSVPSAQPSGTFSLDKFDTSSISMCKVGESILISGLVQTLETRFKEKTPLLGDIPLLNLFFAESKKRTDQRELVVVITPNPVFPDRQAARPISKDREHLIEQ